MRAIAKHRAQSIVLVVTIMGRFIPVTVPAIDAFDALEPLSPRTPFARRLLLAPL